MASAVGPAWRAPLLLMMALGCSPERASPTRSAPDDDDGGAGAGGTSAMDRDSGGGGACSVVKHVEVPLELFGDAVDPPTVTRWGDRFAVLDSGSITQNRAADIAVVSWEGVDIQQHLALPGLCPDDVCSNVLGLAVLATATGMPQFLLVDADAVGSMPTYPLHARAWDSAQSDPFDAPLLDAHITAITTRIVMRASRDGTRALFVLGNIDTTELQTIEVGADATVVAPEGTMTLSSAYWDCLAVIPTSEAGTISAVAKTESGTELIWHLRELDAEANTVLDTSVTIPVGDALGYVDCPTVVESPEGYAAQWVSTDGESLVVTVKRDAAPRAAPGLVRFDASPGLLAGIVDGELFFQGFVDDEHRGFVRIKEDGRPGGPPITLPALPESTIQHRRALPTVLSVEGASLYLSYELESARVLEEIRCR